MARWSRLATVTFALAAAALLATAPPAGATAGDVEGAMKKCGKCHRNYLTDFLPTKHAQAFIHHPVNALMESGCDACHGDPALHVADAEAKVDAGSPPVDLSLIVRLTKESPLDNDAKNRICAACHEGTANGAWWEGSAHQSAGLACVDCHQYGLAVNPVKRREGIDKTALAASVKTSVELCGRCHVQKRATLMRSSHMPLREGTMACDDCHNPHGAPGPHQLRQATVNENCYSCHAEKRGPLLWEHDPVRENCSTCHDPHGSNFESMLKIKQPYLCQTCHAANYHPSTPYDGAGVVANGGAAKQQIFRGCLNCHPMVHGSNHPSGPRFTR